MGWLFFIADDRILWISQIGSRISRIFEHGFHGEITFTDKFQRCSNG